MSAWYRRSGDVLTLTLHIQPGAKRSELAGLHGEALKIRLDFLPAEPPPAPLFQPAPASAAAEVPAAQPAAK